MRNSFFLKLVLLIAISQYHFMAQAISVTDYVDGALASNPSTEAALRKIESAELGVARAWDAYLPKANLIYGYNYSNTSAGTSNSISGSWGPSASIAITLWDSGARKLSINLAKLALRNSQIASTAVRQALIVQTMKIYGAWDGQSSFEYVYAGLARALDKLIVQISDANRPSESGLRLLTSKRDEYLQKMTTARSAADTLSIQVEGISGIAPKPYVEDTREERAEIHSFFMDLLLETPLPTLKDAEEALLQNNLALQASKYGIESTQLSQKLNFVSQTGVRIELIGSSALTMGSRSVSNQGGAYVDHDISQRGRGVGVLLTLPLNPQLLKTPRIDHLNLSAAILSDEQLKKDLMTSMKSAHRNITLLREQLKQLTDRKQKPSLKMTSYSDQEITSLMAYLQSVEEFSKQINTQGQTLFSSTVDLFSLIYNLESYLQTMKKK